MGVTTEPAAMPEPAPTEGEAAVPVDGGDMSVGGVSTLNSEGQEETWEEEPVGEKVQETVQIRKCIPIKMASTEGKYLDEKVWPTLRVSCSFSCQLHSVRSDRCFNRTPNSACAGEAAPFGSVQYPKGSTAELPRWHVRGRGPSSDTATGRCALRPFSLIPPLLSTTPQFLV